MPSFLSAFLASCRKSLSLRQISRVLGRRVKPDIGAMARSFEEQARAEQRLVDLVESDAVLSTIATRFGATRETLLKCYRSLCVVGGAQWARGYWVPASALSFGPTLLFVLSATNGGREASRDVWMEVALRLIDYFENGEVGLVA
jgi:hypothetical protein